MSDRYCFQFETTKNFPASEGPPIQVTYTFYSRGKKWAYFTTGASSALKSGDVSSDMIHEQARYVLETLHASPEDLASNKRGNRRNKRHHARA